MPIYERLQQALAPASNDPRLDDFLGHSLHLAAEALIQLAPAAAAQAAALDKIVDLAEFVAQNWNAIPDAVEQGTEPAPAGMTELQPDVFEPAPAESPEPTTVASDSTIMVSEPVAANPEPANLKLIGVDQASPGQDYDVNWIAGER